MEEERYTKDLLACKQAITEASRLLVLFSPLLTLKVASYLKKEVSVNDPNDPCRKRAACLGKEKNSHREPSEHREAPADFLPLTRTNNCFLGT